MAKNQITLGGLEKIYGKFSGSIDKASKKYGVPKELITTVIAQESNGNRFALSPAKAEGLMQIMPTTRKQLMQNETDLKDDGYDPHTSIMLGSKYLSQLIKQYNGKTDLALAAYNAGMGRVKNKVPNIPETQNYVKSVSSAYENYMAQMKLPKEQRQYLNPLNDFTLDRAISQRKADIAAFKQYEKQSLQQEKATTADWWSEAWDTFARATPTAKVIDEIQMRNLATKDDNYRYDQGVVSNDFTRYGIAFTPDNTDFMSKSVSAEDYNNRLNMLRYHSQLDNLAMSVISRNAFDNLTMAGMTIGDPTIGLSITAIPRALSAMRLGSRMSSAYGGAIGLQAGIAATKNEYMAGYTDSDAVIDTLLGGIIDGTLTKGVFKPTAKIIDNPKEFITIRQSTLGVANAPVEVKISTSRQYQWGASAPMQQGDDIASQAVKVSDDTLARKATEEGNRLAEARAIASAKIAAKTEARKVTETAQIAEAKVTFDAVKAENAKKIYDAQFAKSGLTKEEFDARIDELPQTAQDVSDTIDEVLGFGDTPTKNKMIKDLYNIIDEVKRVSPATAESLRYKLDNGLNKTAKAPKAVMTPKGRIVFTKGQQSFNKILKGINSHIRASVKKAEALADEAIKASGRLPDPSLSAKTIKESLERQKEIYTRMKSAVDEINHAFTESLNGMMLSRFASDIERASFLDDLTKAINDEFDSNIKLTWKNGEIVSSGGVEFKVKGDVGRNNKAKLTIAVGTLLATSSAFASEGEDNGIAVVPWVIAIGLAYAIGSTAVIRILEKKGMEKAAKDYFDKVKQTERIATIKSDPLYKRAWKAATTFDNYRTGYMESLAYIIKNGTEEQIALARKLVRDWVDPQKGIAADSEKLSNVRSAEARLAIEADKQFDAWLIETGTKDNYSKVYGAIGKESPARETFEEAVADYLEFGGDAPASVKAYANQIKLERNLAVDELTKQGVSKFLGEDVAKFKENYFTRYLKRGNWQKIIGDQANREKLVQSLGGAMAKAMGKSVDDDVLALADTYIQTVTSMHITSSTTAVPDVKALLKQMQKNGIDVGGIDVDEFLKEVHRDSDALSRGKIRIPMDLRAFKPFPVEIDGETHIISKSSLFDRDAMNVTKRYLNETYGYAAAVKTTGYKSYGLLLDAISKMGTNPEVAIKLKTYADSIFGRPTVDASSETVQNVIAMKAGANSVLALSTLTTSFELLKAVSATFGKDGSKLARQQFLMATGNLVKSMFGRKDFNKTWLAKMMTNNVNGLGGATLRCDTNFKAIDDIVNLNDMSAGNFREVVKRVGFFGLKLSHLIQLDDFYKNIANVYAATNLARVAHGANIFDAGKMSMYGIDDVAKARLRTFLKLDSNDEIIEFDFDALPDADKDLFRNITERIVMDRSTWTALGSIPTGMVNNAAGILLSSLTHFMTQTYTTQFIAKGKYGGVSNYSDMALWVLSGYTTYYAKAYATGKEPKHEDAVLYAILSSPIMSPVNVAGMMIDPVSLSVMNRIAEYAKSNAEYGVEELTK